MKLLDMFRKKEEVSSPINSMPVNNDTLSQANVIFQRYRSGLATRDNRIMNNEQWYRVRNFATADSEVKPSSAWLFNSICSKHADMMDNIPQANVLPREQADEEEAKRLSSIIPCIMKANHFTKAYSDACLDKLKSGTGAYCITWDSSKLNGLGDIAINAIDPINIYTEPSLDDIQLSPNLFLLTLADNESLKEQYEGIEDHLGITENVRMYAGDNYDTTDKSVVVDWYYKKLITLPDGTQKHLLHYAKYVNDFLIYSTENNDPFTPLYEHGKYPFVMDVLYPIKASAYGFGFIDFGKNPQEYIDKADQAILENIYANAHPRWFIRNDGAVREDEYRDINNKFIHVNGASLGDDSIRPVTMNQLPSGAIDVLQYKVDELKETTGNRDVMNGGTQSGVTAASAVAALQESGGKLVRDINRMSYQAFEEIVTQVIELIRQFYDLPRQFRIVGEQGAYEYITYNNANLQAQSTGVLGGVEGWRLPAFDLDIVAQKSTQYTKMANNELALQLWQQGFFNPMMAAPALACLEMMDFDQRDKVKRLILQNAQMGMAMMSPTGSGDEVNLDESTESPVTEKARTRANQTAEV